MQIIASLEVYSFGYPSDIRPIIDKISPEESVPVKEPSYPNEDTRDGDEMVDVESKLTEDGHINLTFTSHGKRHQLDLTESKTKFGDIPIKLVGKSSEFEDEVVSAMKVISFT